MEWGPGVGVGMIYPGQKLLMHGFLVLAMSAGSVVEVRAEAVSGEVLVKGEAIYRKLCIECHGEKGVGVDDKYKEPLYGDRSLASLTRRIDKTMPEDKPELCVGEDAAAVAAYIYEAFYSPQSRAGQETVRAEVTRLTVGQFRNSVADWLGQLDWRPAWGPAGERGLKGEYFGSQHFSGKKEKEGKDKFERRDAEVAFAFGAESPDPALMGAEEFSIRWSGSVVAPETGMYEFILKTPNGAKLSVNRDEPPLIDGWVSSGPEVREEKGSIYLLGGRAYRLKLEYFKFKDKAASIELWWKTPQGVPERIPAEHLLPVEVRGIPVVSAPFPADDRSLGYERGSAVSRAWYDAVSASAIKAAEYVAERLPELSPVKADTPDRLAKTREFARHLVSTAFRRGLSEEDADVVVGSHFKEGAVPEVALKRAVMAILMSPRFLYPEVGQPEVPDGFTMAGRLALALWDSLPDQELMKAAAEGRLNTPEGLLAEGRRMLQDPRTKEKLRGFFHHWLELKEADTIAKDPEAFPGFDAAVLTDLRRSLDRFIDRIVWEGGSDYRELLQADWLMLNPRLAALYGKEVKGPGFEPVKFAPGERSGVITHPYLLTSFAYFKNTSPIHRGVFLTRNIVGRQLKPPPEAVEFKDGNFDPTFTMREKVTEITRPTACMGCHTTINPLGFSLENFDAIGRWRTQDNGKPVITGSDFTGDDGETIRLEKPGDVAAFAVGSEAAHRTFIRHLFHHTVKQPAAAYGPDTMDRLLKSFTESNFSVQELLLQAALTAVAHGLPAEPGKAATGP